MTVTPYRPTYIKQFESGLVKNRQEFILPEDAYPTLENMFIFRERIQRRQGLQFLGRLSRILSSVSAGTYSTTMGSNSFNVFTGLGLLSTEPNAELQVATASSPITLVFGSTISQTLTDSTGTGVMVVSGVGPIVSATISYATGIVSIIGSSAVGPATVTASFVYYPNLPCMGIRSQETAGDLIADTIFFDTKYAYQYTGSVFQELPSTTPTTWTGTNYNFFFTTNYWVDSLNNKLFWATNFSGTSGDPIRYYNTVTWTNFAPYLGTSGQYLQQCLAILPFRGRLLAFNTLEGANLGAALPFYQRIRWSAIGNPVPNPAAMPPYQPWDSSPSGQGGFLDIPTSENITAVGFVRDNLVIYCERSTWQLRYTGRSISPFQIERVNSELGSYSAFSAVQFDTSLVGIGDKGVVECDSYKSERIDIKIPDLVFGFSSANNAPIRIQGIRDIQQRVAYWTYVDNGSSYDASEDPYTTIFPNSRLVYNYENKSWATYTDSITALGNFQQTNSDTYISADCTWEEANFPWINIPDNFPAIVGGNQQGFVFYLGNNLQPQVSNDQTLTILGLSQVGSTTLVTSPNHNLIDNQVIQIGNIITSDPFYTYLNDNIYGVIINDINSFFIFSYTYSNGNFTTDVPSTASGYLGGASIKVRDGFSIVSKKFNFLEQGQNIQMGYMDLLMSSTTNGAITMNIFLNYNQDRPINVAPENSSVQTNLPDPFFNSIISTSESPLGEIQGSKYMQRVFCPVRGAFITLQFTLSNLQLIGQEQTSNVQLDAQILWTRPAGRLQSW